jgi:hypothetical protein
MIALFLPLLMWILRRLMVRADNGWFACFANLKG